MQLVGQPHRPLCCHRADPQLSMADPLQVLNCGSAAAQQYILRMLHHWAQVGMGPVRLPGAC